MCASLSHDLHVYNSYWQAIHNHISNFQCKKIALIFTVTVVRLKVVTLDLIINRWHEVQRCKAGSYFHTQKQYCVFHMQKQLNNQFFKIFSLYKWKQMCDTDFVQKVRFSSRLISSILLKRVFRWDRLIWSNLMNLWFCTS